MSQEALSDVLQAAIKALTRHPSLNAAVSSLRSAVVLLGLPDTSDPPSHSTSLNSLFSIVLLPLLDIPGQSNTVLPVLGHLLDYFLDQVKVCIRGHEEEPFMTTKGEQNRAEAWEDSIGHVLRGLKSWLADLDLGPDETLREKEALGKSLVPVLGRIIQQPRIHPMLQRRVLDVCYYATQSCNANKNLLTQLTVFGPHLLAQLIYHAGDFGVTERALELGFRLGHYVGFTHGKPAKSLWEGSLFPARYYENSERLGLLAEWRKLKPESYDETCVRVHRMISNRRPDNFKAIFCLALAVNGRSIMPVDAPDTLSPATFGADIHFNRLSFTAVTSVPVCKIDKGEAKRMDHVEDDEENSVQAILEASWDSVERAEIVDVQDDSYYVWLVLSSPPTLDSDPVDKSPRGQDEIVFHVRLRDLEYLKSLCAERHLKMAFHTSQSPTRSATKASLPAPGRSKSPPPPPLEITRPIDLGMARGRASQRLLQSSSPQTNEVVEVPMIARDGRGGTRSTSIASTASTVDKANEVVSKGRRSDPVDPASKCGNAPGVFKNSLDFNPFAIGEPATSPRVESKSLPSLVPAAPPLHPAMESRKSEPVPSVGTKARQALPAATKTPFEDFMNEDAGLAQKLPFVKKKTAKQLATEVAGAPATRAAERGKSAKLPLTTKLTQGRSSSLSSTSDDTDHQYRPPNSTKSRISLATRSKAAKVLSPPVALPKRARPPPPPEQSLETLSPPKSAKVKYGKKADKKTAIELSDESSEDDTEVEEKSHEGEEAAFPALPAPSQVPKRCTGRPSRHAVAGEDEFAPPKHAPSKTTSSKASPNVAPSRPRRSAKAATTFKYTEKDESDFDSSMEVERVEAAALEAKRQEDRERSGVVAQEKANRDESKARLAKLAQEKREKEAAQRQMDAEAAQMKKEQADARAKKSKSRLFQTSEKESALPSKRPHDSDRVDAKSSLKRQKANHVKVVAFAEQNVDLAPANHHSPPPTSARERPTEPAVLALSFDDTPVPEHDSVEDVDMDEEDRGLTELMQKTLRKAGKRISKSALAAALAAYSQGSGGDDDHDDDDDDDDDDDAEKSDRDGVVERSNRTFPAPLPKQPASHTVALPIAVPLKQLPQPKPKSPKPSSVSRVPAQLVKSPKENCRRRRDISSPANVHAESAEEEERDMCEGVDDEERELANLLKEVSMIVLDNYASRKTEQARAFDSSKRALDAKVYRLANQFTEETAQICIKAQELAASRGAPEYAKVMHSWEKALQKSAKAVAAVNKAMTIAS